MSNHQPNVWQTGARGGRHPASASRTPQTRSGTASPAQPNSPPPPPKDSNTSNVSSAPRSQTPVAPATNVWTQRAAANNNNNNNTSATTNVPSNGPEAATAAAGGGAKAGGSGSTGPTPKSRTPTLPSQPATHVNASGSGGGGGGGGTRTPVMNGFNAAEVKAFLERGPAPAAYKVPNASGELPASATNTSGTAATGGASGGSHQRNESSATAKGSLMANNQPFFAQLAKQIAAFQGGG